LPKAPAQRPPLEPARTATSPLPVEPAPASPDRVSRGFTLRFASARALTHLVATGRVRMYTRDAQGRFRRVEFAGARIRLVEGPAPRAYHEMEPGTVPGTFLLAAGDVGELTWGVVLPAELERRIARLVRSRDGGVLVIDAAGHVRLREAGR
jgi:hypothetical protein